MKAHGTVLGLALLMALTGCARSPTPAMVGTVMTEKVKAIDFSLTDQKGADYKLSASQGKVVVLSFIYTHCDDICPFVSLKIKDARDLLGPLANKVEFVAVTTDPDRDTPEVNAAYSKEAGLYDTWHFVTGSMTDVKKVWADFGVGVHRVADSGNAPSEESGGSLGDMGNSAAKGLSQSDLALGKTIGDAFGGGYEVTHTAPFWFIDRKGFLRAILSADALPADIVANIKSLLAGG